MDSSRSVGAVCVLVEGAGSREALLSVAADLLEAPRLKLAAPSCPP
jgi:hypothetical protein